VSRSCLHFSRNGLDLEEKELTRIANFCRRRRPLRRCDWTLGLFIRIRRVSGPPRFSPGVDGSNFVEAAAPDVYKDLWATLDLFQLSLDAYSPAVTYPGAIPQRFKLGLRKNFSLE
jgi:hypothetical protein